MLAPTLHVSLNVRSPSIVFVIFAVLPGLQFDMGVPISNAYVASVILSLGVNEHCVFPHGLQSNSSNKLLGFAGVGFGVDGGWLVDVGWLVVANVIGAVVALGVMDAAVDMEVATPTTPGAAV